jgi:hypothetical protein
MRSLRDVPNFWHVHIFWYLIILHFFNWSQVMPWKWVPLECLRGSAVWNMTTDAWAYGVTLWEIFTLGRTPYEHMGIRDVVNMLASGVFLPCPEYVRNETWGTRYLLFRSLQITKRGVHSEDKNVLCN